MQIWDTQTGRQLLVDQRETLRLGDIVPVGDLFDVIAHGDEAFSQEMAIHFENARRLYHQKLLPLLETYTPWLAMPQSVPVPASAMLVT